MNDENIIFLLNKDHTVSYISESEICNIDPYTSLIALIPIKIYDGFSYIPVMVSDMIKECKFDLNATCDIHTYGYENDVLYDDMYVEIKHVHLKSETIPNFYRIMASLYSLTAVNEVINPEWSDEFALFGLFNSSVDIEYRNYSIHDVTSRSDYKVNETAHKQYSSDSVSYLISHIERLMTIDKKGNFDPRGIRLITDVENNIYLHNDKWYDNDDRLNDSDIVLVKMPTFGILTAVPLAHYKLLDKFYDIQMWWDMFTIYHDSDNLYDPGELSVTVVEENCDDFEVIMDGNVRVYSTTSAITMLTQLKYIMHGIVEYGKAIWGTIVNDIVFTISASNRAKPNDYLRKEFRYNITYSTIDNVDDIYSDFMRKLYNFYYRGDLQ